MQVNFRIVLSRFLPVRSVGGDVIDLLGFSDKDFLGSLVRLPDRIHPEDAGLTASLFSPESKAPGNLTLRVRHADGRIRVLRAQFKKEGPPRGEVVLELLLEDVRNLSEPGDALLSANFKTLIEHTSDYIYVKNRNHVFLAASQTVPSLTESARDSSELVGKTDYDIHPEEIADIGYRLENQAMAEGRRVNSIQSLVAQDGSKRWIDNRKYPINGPDGKIVGIFGVAPDITVYIEDQLKLRGSEESLREAQTIAGLGSFTLDIPSRFWRLSPELDALLGIGADYNRAFEGIWPLIHPHDREIIEERFEGYFSGERRTFDSEYRIIRHSDGLVRWVHTRGRLEVDAQGKPLFLHGTVQDITARKQAETALRESEDFLRLFIEHAPAALAMFDREMCYLAASRRWMEMHSILGVEVVGRSQYDVFPEIPESWREEHRRCLAGENLPVDERPLVRTNGAVQWVRREVLPWRSGDGSVGGVVIFAEDITQQKEIEDRLRLAATVFTGASEGITITDASGRILDVNAAFTRITGYSREEVLGQNPRILKSGLQSKEFYENMWATLKSEGQWTGEIWNRAKNGDIYAEKLTIRARYDASGKVQQYVAHFTDISEIKERELRLEHMANFDALTGLPNRTLFMDRLRQAMAQEHRHHQSLAVAYFDLDGFKAINDRYGQGTGDGLLTAVAFRMKRVMRDGDTLARLGGDEFAAVLLDVSDAKALTHALNRMLKAAGQEAQIGDFNVRASASAGVAVYPQDEEVDADGLLRQAGQALYEAKLAGGNRHHRFDPSQDLQARSRLENLEHIRQGLAARQFVLYYQPVVNMRSGEIVGAEALIRWQHPEQGLLPPGMFFPVIQNHPLSIEVGEWVIESALAQMESWKAQGLDLQVSVNVSAIELQQAGFAERLRTRLAAHPSIDPLRLELEVVETSALHDVVQSSQVIAACREIGVQIALDDFGTGYASLAYLQRLPANILKIDQSFVRGLLDEPDSLTILEGMMGLATAFRRQVVAEGVETVELGHMLLQIGCEIGQGYGIARPMPAAEIPAWVARWSPDSRWTSVPAVHADNRALLYASVEHRAWMGAFEACLQGRRAAPPPLDASQCRMGAWLNAERRSARRTLSAIQAIDLLHRELHALAADIHELKNGSRKTDGLKRLRQLQYLQEKCLKRLETFARSGGGKSLRGGAAREASHAGMT